MSLTKDLLRVRAQIKTLEAEEAAIVQDILSKTKHEHGQHTYDFEGRKVVVKTGFNTTVDKAKCNASFEEWIEKWGPAFPINRSYAYTPRTKDFDAAMSDGSPELRKVLADIVTQKPAKPNVKVEG
jgi:hypothetical protein